MRRHVPLPIRLRARWPRLERPPEAMRPRRLEAIQAGITAKLARRFLRPWGVALVERPAGFFG